MTRNCSTAVPVEAVILAAIVVLLMVLASFPVEARAVQARPALHFDQDALMLPPGIVPAQAIYKPEPPAKPIIAVPPDFDPAAWIIVAFIALGGVGWLVFVIMQPWRFPVCTETGEAEEPQDLHSWGQREDRSKCAMPGPMQDTLNRRKD